MVTPNAAKTVLVVDDDADLREAVAELLEHHGYRVLQAVDGREALDLLRDCRGDPCLVLLDMLMPGMNGAEVLAVLRQGQRLGALPVVVCSASAATSETHGARRLLRKPVSEDLLLDVVAEFCQDAQGS